MIDAGIYKGRAIKGSEQFGHTNNGNEQVAIDFMLNNGSRVTTFLYFSDKAMPYSLDRLKALGWTGGDITKLDGIDANEVDVSIEHGEYQGKPTMKVNIMTGGTVKLESTMDDRAKRAFAARVSAALKASGNGAPAARAPKPTENDDEIPF